MDSLQIYLEATGDLLGHPGNFGDPIYDLDAGEDSWVMIDYSINGAGPGGSGKGDMLLYVPKSLFTGPNQYIYLYSLFGANSIADDGFEEWAHGIDAPIPEPATILLLALGSFVLLRRRRRA
jgi:hypothetical protein